MAWCEPIRYCASLDVDWGTLGVNLPAVRAKRNAARRNTLDCGTMGKPCRCGSGEASEPEGANEAIATDYIFGFGQ